MKTLSEHTESTKVAEGSVSVWEEMLCIKSPASCDIWEVPVVSTVPKEQSAQCWQLCSPLPIPNATDSLEREPSLLFVGGLIGVRSGVV